MRAFHITLLFPRLFTSSFRLFTIKSDKLVLPNRTQQFFSWRRSEYLSAQRRAVARAESMVQRKWTSRAPQPKWRICPAIASRTGWLQTDVDWMTGMLDSVFFHIFHCGSLLYMCLKSYSYLRWWLSFYRSISFELEARRYQTMLFICNSCFHVCMRFPRQLGPSWL